jgi:hypothetical protein
VIVWWPSEAVDIELAEPVPDRVGVDGEAFGGLFDVTPLNATPFPLRYRHGKIIFPNSQQRKGRCIVDVTTPHNKAMPSDPRSSRR